MSRSPWGRPAQREREARADDRHEPSASDPGAAHVRREDFAPALGLDFEWGGGEVILMHVALRSFDIDPLDIKCLDLEVHHVDSVSVDVV